MLSALNSVQALLLVGLAVLAFGMNAYALVDALRQRKDAFQAAGKLTKQIWTIILAVAAVLGFIFLVGQFNSPTSFLVLNFVNIIAFVASVVYIVDVRPAVRRLTGGSSSGGPYGGW